MNPHIKKAEDALHFSEYQARGLTERQIDAAQAQAQATLALVYAQETANLLAFERSQWEAFRRGELTAEGVELWERIAKQLKERGLA